MLLGSLTKGSDRLDYPVTVPAGPDLDYLHVSIVAVADDGLDLERAPQSCSET